MLIHINPKPEFDAYRVDAIRNQLEENEYIVDPQQVANKFIDLEAAIYGRN